MKIQNVMLVIALMVFSIFSANVIAMTEGKPEKSDEEFCVQEAKESGYQEGEELKVYVMQCLEEIQGQKKDDLKAGSNE